MAGFFDQLHGEYTPSNEKRKGKGGKKHLKRKIKEVKKDNKKLTEKLEKYKRRLKDTEARLDRLERNRHD